LNDVLEYTLPDYYDPDGLDDVSLQIAGNLGHFFKTQGETIRVEPLLPVDVGIYTVIVTLRDSLFTTIDTFLVTVKLGDFIPDNPDLPNLPDLPDLPDTPDVPDIPAFPQEPDIPTLPELEEGFELPDLEN